MGCSDGSIILLSVAINQSVGLGRYTVSGRQCHTQYPACMIHNSTYQLNNNKNDNTLSGAQVFLRSTAHEIW